MAITNKNTRLVHRKEWQMMTPLLISGTGYSASSSGRGFIAAEDGTSDYALYMYDSATHFLYSHDEDAWLTAASGSFAGSFSAGSCGIHNKWSANYYSSAKGSTNTVVVNSSLFNIGQPIVGQTLEFLSGPYFGTRTAISSIVYDVPAVQTVTTATSSSNQCILRSAAGVAIGQQVSGSGITAGTTVTNVSGNTVTLSASYSLSLGQDLTFYGTTGLVALTLNTTLANPVDIYHSFRITSGRYYWFGSYTAQATSTFKEFDLGTMTWRGAQAPVNPSAPSLTTNSTTGGTIAAGTYNYAIVATNSNGSDSPPSPPLSVTTTGSTSSVTISWNRVPGAVSYKVYRAGSGSTTTTDFSSGSTLLTTITNGGGTTTYTDTATTPSAGNPAVTGTSNSSNSLTYLLSVTTQLPTVWGTDGRMVAPFNYGEIYSPSTALGATPATQTATSGSTTSITQSTKNWTTNQWTNYQVRITGNTGAGQIRTIYSNTPTQLNVAASTTGSTSGASTTLTVTSGTGIVPGMPISGSGISGNCVVVAVSGTTVTMSSTQTISSTTLTFGIPWNTAPDNTSTYIIEGNEDHLYLVGNGSTTFNSLYSLHRYTISNDQWIGNIANGLTGRPNSISAGMMANYIGRTNNATWADETNVKDGRYIYSFRGGSVTTIPLERYDIASNAWTAPAYSGSISGTTALETFTTGSASAVAHNYIFLRRNNDHRYFKYDVITNTILPVNHNLYADSTQYVGNKIWIRNYQATSTDGSETLKWLYSYTNNSYVLHRLLVY